MPTENCKKVTGKRKGMKQFCNKPMTKISIGWVCESCNLVHDDQGEIWFTLTAPTVAKIERLIKGGSK